MSETTATQCQGLLDVHALERPWCTEYYVTAAADGSLAGVDAARSVYADLAELVSNRGIEPIQEKVYGQLDIREEVLAARAAALASHGLDPALPVTFIDGRPPGGGQFGGVQVWGITARDSSVTSVRTVPGTHGTSGRTWTGPGFRMFYQPAVLGSHPDGSMPDCATGQARRMFANATASLDGQGLIYPQVIRTWIYLTRLLDWYGEFNRVRTAHHTLVGLGGDANDAIFPASTGIQGTPGGAECCMDVMALETTGDERVRVRPILGSRRQPPAFSYGSAFSRALALEMDGRQIIYISGTASIDRAGRSIHVGDPEAQSFETLLNIASLLEDQGGSLDNICMATLFCKDRDAYDAYGRVTQLLRAPVFPTIPVRADVCRGDLLVEIEAVAVI